VTQTAPSQNQWLSPTGIAVGISVLSLVVASTSLAWNIYRDIVLKPRLKVQLGIYKLASPGREPTTHLMVSTTNHGPGKTTISMIQGRRIAGWRWLRSKQQNFVVLQDWTNPLSGKLPARLDVGERVSLLLPYDRKCMLAGGVTDVGVSDFFGRLHWAPRAEVAQALLEFARDFPNASA
jgi:hypothetical protein